MMGRKLTEKQKKALLITGITAAVYISLKYILPLTIPFLLAYLTALLLNPAAERIHKKFHIRKGITAGVLMAVLIVLLFSGICFLGKMLFEQISMAAAGFPAFLEQISVWLNDTCCKCDDFLGISRGTSQEFLYEQYERIAGSMETDAGSRMMEKSVSILKNFVKTGAMFVVVSIGSVLIVSNMERIRRYRSISVFRQEIAAVTGCLSRVGKAFFRTQILIMLATGSICTIGLFVLGNPYALLLGILIGIVDLLPLFGTGTVLIPWFLFSLVGRNWNYAAGLAVIYVICYFLREVMEAKLMSGHIGIAPLEMLVSIYVGLMLFGILGFFLGPFGFMVIRELVELYTGKGISAG